MHYLWISSTKAYFNVLLNLVAHVQALKTEMAGLADWWCQNGTSFSAWWSATSIGQLFCNIYSVVGAALCVEDGVIRYLTKACAQFLLLCGSLLQLTNAGSCSYQLRR
jgi:hypothetical protein